MVVCPSSSCSASFEDLLDLNVPRAYLHACLSLADSMLRTLGRLLVYVIGAPYSVGARVTPSFPLQSAASIVPAGVMTRLYCLPRTVQRGLFRLLSARLRIAEVRCTRLRVRLVMVVGGLGSTSSAARTGSAGVVCSSVLGSPQLPNFFLKSTCSFESPS